MKTTIDDINQHDINNTNQNNWINKISIIR